MSAGRRHDHSDDTDDAAASIEELVEAAATLGIDRFVMPFDIMRLAGLIARHGHSENVTPRLRAIVEDRDNHFARHTALRALRLILGGRVDCALLAKALEILRVDGAAPVRAEAVRLLKDSGSRSAEVKQALMRTAATDTQDYVRSGAQDVLDAMAASGWD